MFCNFARLFLMGMGIILSLVGGTVIVSYITTLFGMLSAAQSASLSPRREVPSLVPGSSSCPADVFLPCWTHGRPATLDVSVISPLQQLTLQEAASSQGHALSCRCEEVSCSLYRLPLCW